MKNTLVVFAFLVIFAFIPTQEVSKMTGNGNCVVSLNAGFAKHAKKISYIVNHTKNHIRMVTELYYF